MPIRWALSGRVTEICPSVPLPSCVRDGGKAFSHLRSQRFRRPVSERGRFLLGGFAVGIYRNLSHMIGHTAATCERDGGLGGCGFSCFVFNGGRRCSNWPVGQLPIWLPSQTGCTDRYKSTAHNGLGTLVDFCWAPLLQFFSWTQVLAPQQTFLIESFRRQKQTLFLMPRQIIQLHQTVAPLCPCHRGGQTSFSPPCHSSWMSGTRTLTLTP